MDASENPRFVEYMKIVDKYRVLGVRTNADTPEDAQNAINFGAEGIGLFRIEHMFYGQNSEQPLSKLRKMILSNTEEERISALKELEPFVTEAVKGTMKVMDGKPVTFRLLDPPYMNLFLKQQKTERTGRRVRHSVEEIRKRGELRHEVNIDGPPRSTSRNHISGSFEMQYRAIFTATAELMAEGFQPQPRFVTLTVNSKRADSKSYLRQVHSEVVAATGKNSLTIRYNDRNPRAAVLADEMARTAQFFSFEQMTLLR